MELARISRVLIDERRHPGLRELTRTGLTNLLSGAAANPPSWDVVRTFLLACARHARDHGVALPDALVDPIRWETRLAALAEVLRALDVPTERANTGVDSPPVRMAVSGYLHQIQRLAAADFVGREDELAAMTAFATATEEQERGAWWRWLAPAWAGKTALMAHFALHPPSQVRIVAFFITARLAGQNGRSAFCEVVQRQLYALLGQEEPLGTEHTRDEQFLHALERAAACCAQQGQRLVLLVDGLDEDRGVTSGPDAHSIAALLPAVPPHGARVIVAGRPHPPVPDDVPDRHPLRSAGIDHVLEDSPSSRAVKAEAEQDLLRLVNGGGLGRDLVGLVAAAGGGLSASDLAQLAAEDITPRRVQRELGAVGGRAFRTRPPVWGSPDAQDVYLLAHEEIQRAAHEDVLTESQLDGYRARLRDWAEEYRAAGWPAGTPEYLLQGYLQHVRERDDLDELVRLATDTERHERLWSVSGADRAALDEITTAFDLLLARGDTTETAVAAAVRLAVCRGALYARSAGLPAVLVDVWARLGHVDRAVALALANPEPQNRSIQLANVAKALDAAGRSQDVIPVLLKAADLALALTNPEQRAQALADIADVMTETGRAQEGVELRRRSAHLAREASEAAQAVTGGWERDHALALAVGALARTDQHDQAERIALVITERGRAEYGPRGRDQALSACVHALVLKGCTEAAERLVADIDDISERDGARMAVIAAIARTGEYQRAVDLTDTIVARWEQARALADIAGVLAQAGRQEEAEMLARRTVSFAQTLTRGSLPEEALAAAAGALARVGRLPDAMNLALTLSDEGDRDQARAAIAAALIEAGDSKSAEEVAETIGDAGCQAHVLAELAKALAQMGRRWRAAELAHRAVELARSLVPPYQRQWQLTVIAKALARTGQHRCAADLAASIIAPADRVPVLAALVDALAGAGQDASADDVARQTAALASEVRDPFGQSAAAAAAAGALARVGRFREAERLARQAWGVFGERATAMTAVASAFARAGRTGTALELAGQAVGFGAPYEKALAAVARALAETGRHTDAEKVARGAAASVLAYAERESSIDSWEIRVDALAAVADDLAGAGHATLAEGLARSAEALIPATGGVGNRLSGLAAVARALARAGSDEDAAALARKAEDLARTYADPKEKAWSLLLVAAVPLTDENWRRRLLVEALALADWVQAVTVIESVAPTVLDDLTSWVA